MLIDKNKKNELVISFEYNSAIVSIVQQFDSRKFDNKTKSWTVPTLHLINVLDTLIPLGFKTTDELKEEYYKRKKRRKTIERIKEGNLNNAEKQLLKNTKLPLFDYQKTGAGFLIASKSALLGDDPGAGKSIQSLAATLLTDSKRNLIVCPSTLKLNWSDEIKKWLPSAKIFVVAGTKTERLKIYKKALREIDRFYLIINYELLLRDIEELKEF